MGDGKLPSLSDDLDVIIVGAGVGGLYAIHKLRGLGFKVRAFEAAIDLGGTWFWNRYPGCRCDVESLEYSYSFSDELQQAWRWRDRYGTQAQILDYLNHIADRFDLRPHITFNTRIETAHFDEMTSLWTLATSDGERFVAPFCIMATGNLSRPNMPDLPGIDDFAGDCYHTGLWPHADVDFRGKRVGVIGTGSSGVQMIPHIAEQAEHLYVFQRTANFILPAHNAVISDQQDREHKADYPAHRRAAFSTPFGIAGYPPPTCSALDVSAEERNAIYEQKWQAGGTISFLYSFTDLLTNTEANETAAEFVRDKIRSKVHDQKSAALLCPDSHPIGTKRLILDSGYYEAFNRSNVTLVDVRTAPIQSLTKIGLHTAAADYSLDAIAFATGFDAMTGALLDIDITTSSGVDLAQHWSDGPRTYLGLMTAGLPNIFLITGPQSPGVKSNMMFSIEQHTNWIADCLTHLRARGLTRLMATQDAEAAWVEHNNEVAHSTLYPKANSWYMGANIPGKKRIFMPYVGGCEAYCRTCDEVVSNGYQGFDMR